MPFYDIRGLNVLPKTLNLPLYLKNTESEHVSGDFPSTQVHLFLFL